MRALASFSCLALSLLPSCMATGEREGDVRHSLPRSRVELVSMVVDYDGFAHDGATVTLSDRQLQETGAQILPSTAEDFLPGFLRESETSLFARWIGEGPIVHEDAGKCRILRLRRILSFDTAALAKEFFPNVTRDELTASDEGGAEVVAGEMVFSLARSQHGQAFRVRLDRIYARRPALPLSRLLPTEAPLPVILSLSLRYVYAGEELTHTILFAETIDITSGDFTAGGQLSNWIAVSSKSLPHSIQLSIVGREELNAFNKTLRGAGLKIFDLANSVKGVGIL